MKKLFFICFLSLTCTGYAENKDSVTIDYKYAGLLTNLNFHEDKFALDKGVSARAGGGISWYALPKIKFQSWAFIDYDGKNVIKNVMFGVNYKVVPKINLFFGHIPTLAATTRPVPATADGHFEPWVPSQLPGLAPGASIKYAGSSNDVGVGAYYRLEYPEFHGRLKIGNVLSAGYYNANGKTYGATVQIAKGGYSIRAIATDSLYGLLTSIPLSAKHKLGTYLDAGMNREEIVRAELGFLKFFEEKPFSGLIGIGYSYEIRAIKCYLFFHL